MLTAACAACAATTFFEVGGFSEVLPANFNDVDLSLQGAPRACASSWSPRVELYHFESQIPRAAVHAWELQAAPLQVGLPDCATPTMPTFGPARLNPAVQDDERKSDLMLTRISGRARGQPGRCASSGARCGRAGLRLATSALLAVALS